MAGLITSPKLRAAIAALTVFSLAAAASWATAQQAMPKPATPVATPAPAKLTTKLVDKTMWKDLTPQQQAVLKPLMPEWDKLDATRRTKWLEVANRFSSMKPEEQQRVHERMREWIKLTPEERRVARENFTSAKKIDKDQRSVQWEQYQQLTEEQKKQLAADAKKKSAVANLPAKNQTVVKPVAPVKAGKTVPEPVCPAGTMKNPAAALPACVQVPAPVVAPAPEAAPAAPAATSVPGTPAAPVPNVK